MANYLPIVHIVALVLASWRLAELIAYDNLPLIVGLRNRFPSLLWTCVRCFSVWASAFCVLVFVYFPWGNWPFALSWLVLWRKASLFPLVTIRPTLNGPAITTTLSEAESKALLYQTSDLLRQKDASSISR